MLYLTVTGMIIQSFKSIGKFLFAKLMDKAIQAIQNFTEKKHAIFYIYLNPLKQDISLSPMRSKMPTIESPSQSPKMIKEDSF